MPVLSSCVGGKRKGRVVESKVFVVFRALVIFNFGVPLFDKTGSILVTLTTHYSIFSEDGILLI